MVADKIRQNVIDWNLRRAKLAKNEEDRKRYLKNAELLRESG
jgi:hypothetical protein